MDSEEVPVSAVETDDVPPPDDGVFDEKPPNPVNDSQLFNLITSRFKGVDLDEAVSDVPASWKLEDQSIGMVKFPLVYDPLKYIVNPDEDIFTATLENYDVAFRKCGNISDLDSSKKGAAEFAVKLMVGIVLRCLNFFNDVVTDLSWFEKVTSWDILSLLVQLVNYFDVSYKMLLRVVQRSFMDNLKGTFSEVRSAIGFITDVNGLISRQENFHKLLIWLTSVDETFTFRIVPIVTLKFDSILTVMLKYGNTLSSDAVGFLRIVKKVIKTVGVDLANEWYNYVFDDAIKIIPGYYALRKHGVFNFVYKLKMRENIYLSNLFPPRLFISLFSMIVLNRIWIRDDDISFLNFTKEIYELFGKEDALWPYVMSDPSILSSANKPRKRRHIVIENSNEDGFQEFDGQKSVKDEKMNAVMRKLD